MAKVVHPKQVIFYVDGQGQEPFMDWLESLRDVMGRKRILTRIGRLQEGNYGDCEPAGEGVKELRMFFGPGYRVYIGEEEKNRIVVLCGGDKSTQEQDIEIAQGYWKEYQHNG